MSRYKHGYIATFATINARRVPMDHLFVSKHTPDSGTCAWCERVSLYREIDETGRYIGACRAHRSSLALIRYPRWRRIDASLAAASASSEGTLKARDTRARLGRQTAKFRSG